MHDHVASIICGETLHMNFITEAFSRFPDSRRLGDPSYHDLAGDPQGFVQHVAQLDGSDPILAPHDVAAQVEFESRS